MLMIVAIGCSASSGSTLLSRLLDRHPEIACGQELYLYSKPLLYDDYRFVRSRALLVRLFGLSSNPLDQGRAILKNLSSYQLSRLRAWSWLRQAESIAELAASFQNHILKLTAKRLWVEKTPANIICVGRFLRTFPEARFIHIVRDPRDTVLSIMKRGKGSSALNASETWITRVAAIQPWRSSERVLEIRYEDLVTEPDRTLGKITSFLGVEYRETFFNDDTWSSKELGKFKGHSSWEIDVSGPISTKGVGKYRDTSVDLSVMASVRLTEEFAKILGTRQFSLVELAKTYGYMLDDGVAEVELGTRVLDTRRRKAWLKSRLHGLVEKDGYSDKILF